VLDALKAGKISDELTDVLTAVCKDLSAKYKG
jgi:F-type H+-transporting ATPase subunit alpha